MKKYANLATIFILSITQLQAQTYVPIATTGYTLDAIADAVPASANTGASIDGSDYVMHSVGYANAYNGSSSGLPNSGVITSGLRTYQLQSYSTPNMLYLPGINTSSLTLTTPASYCALSLLGFSTEGAQNMNVTVLFTDNTTQQFNNITVPDWFNTTPAAIYQGFGRVTRTSGAINLPSTTTPRIFTFDFNLSCANRLKQVQGVIIQNTLTNARSCFLALSGVDVPQYSETITNVTCLGGSNGVITVSPAGGIGPFTYTWSTSPVQNGATVSGLMSGAYSYTAKESCLTFVSNPVTITQPAYDTITVNASQFYICTGNSTTLSANGASSYVWTGGAGISAVVVVSPTATTTYSVTGINSLNCTVHGSIAVNVMSPPSVSITQIPPTLCISSADATLNATPAGGYFSGMGLNGNFFSPASLSPGIYTVSYLYIDANDCSAVVSSTINVLPNPSAAFLISPDVFCVKDDPISLTGTPLGGTFSGAGVADNVFNPAASGLGTHTITYAQVNSVNGCVATATRTVKVQLCLAGVGIDIYSAQDLAYTLYPNPNKGSFHIQGTSDTEMIITNELGQHICSIKLNAANEYHAVIEDLPSGIYFVQPANKQGSAQKIIVTK